MFAIVLDFTEQFTVKNDLKISYFSISKLRQNFQFSMDN